MGKITDFHLYHILKLLRPRQWVKNLALFAAIMFGGQLFNPLIVYGVFSGFISFIMLSSSVYIMNDLIDMHKDRLHPFKKGRPIASGKVGVLEATFILLLILVFSFSLAIQVGGLFLLIWVFYLLLHLAYSLVFKSLAIFDILFIAAGYILRVLAGEAISGFHISVWLLLTVISLSLFLAVGKRRSELTLLKNVNGARIEAVRKSLSHYSEKLLDAYLAMFATSTFILYSMFTFLENPRGARIDLDIFPQELLSPYLQRKWLMLTTLPVIYGVMRYLQDIYEKSEGESPDRILLSDKPFLASVLIWALLVIFIIYFVG